MDKFNTGLGYYGKLLSTAASPAVESFMNSSEMLENQENNKSKSDKGYHAVPPPFTGNFIPHKPDLTFMDEIVESENLDVTTVVTPSNVKTVESNHESVGHEADPVYNAWSPIKSLLLFVLCASANTEKEYNDTELLTVGIKREFSVVRTPQQNGAVKRRNRTLIEYQSIVLRLFRYGYVKYRKKTIKNQQETGKRQRVKSKSENSARDHSRISPTQSKKETKKSKVKIKSRG
ncbi:putative ribonuclease H-like domain-containing protein [Tanacetum coccineum]